MVRRHVALAAGVLLLIDVLRVWLPSIITIFGQAASTPAELLGAFGLAWFLAGFAASPLARTLGPRRVAGAAAVALAGLRAALLVVHGGQPQLYLASVGLLAGIAWLAATAESGERLSPGVPAGIAAAAIQHALLGTVDLTWWHTWWAGLLGVVEAVAFGGRRIALAGPERVGGRGLVRRRAGAAAQRHAGDLAGARVDRACPTVPSPVARTVPVYLFIPVTILAALLFLWLAARPPSKPTEALRYVAPPALVGATVIFAFAGGRWLLAAVLLAAPALGTCVGLAGRRPHQQGYALAGGMVVFGLAAIAYYAAYDIGYPNQWVPVVVAVVVAVYAVRSPVHAGKTGAQGEAGGRGRGAVAGAHGGDVPRAADRAPGRIGRAGAAARDVQHPDGLRAGRDVRSGRRGPRRRGRAAGRRHTVRSGPGLAAQRRPRRPGGARRAPAHAVVFRAGRGQRVG